MIITTTPNVEGRSIAAYHGVVTGEAILGANIFRDLFAGIRDIVGGRSGSYEAVLREGRQQALDELAEEARRLGANAIVGVDLDGVIRLFNPSAERLLGWSTARKDGP